MENEQMRRRERLDRGVKVRTDTIYAVSSWKEMIFLLAPRALLIAILLCAPLIAPNLYWQKVICILGVFALLAVGFDFLSNFVGLVSLGGALFIGVGGYISGICNHYLQLPPVLSIPIGTLFGALICTLLLLPTLSLRGIYFAIVTFAYPLMLERIISAANVIGGTDGITGLSMFQNIWISQYIIIGAVLFSTFALRKLVNEDIGMVLRGVKDNDQAIRASGINIMFYKALAVFIAALMGCFGGAFLAHLYGWVGISLFAMDFSIFPLVATAVGGPATLIGPLIGCIILVPISEALRAFGSLRIVVYSMILVVSLGYWREGLLNWVIKKYEKSEHWAEV
jgi:branched-chain amino acid transport system permease protein